MVRFMVLRHHHIQKPELVSGFFTSAVCASSGGASRIRLASGTPPIPTVLALRGLSVLRFYLFSLAIVLCQHKNSPKRL